MPPPAISILLLEDDPVDTHLTRDVLAVDGLAATVRAASNREQFIAALMEPGEIDLVLADFHLPGWDGLQALRETRARRPEVPFILLTGTIGEEATVAALKAGATDLVLKSQLGRLAPAILRALEESARRKALASAQDALRASEERFRALVENSSDAILMVDRAARVQYLSPSALRILGYTPEERVGHETFELIHPDDVAATRAMLQRCAAEADSRERGELRVRHKDGRWVQVECVVSNHLHNPAIRALVVNYRDVSDQRRLEGMLRQAQKMEAVGRVASGIAHDFNNLLGVTLGYSDLILRRLGPDDPLRPKVLEIRKAAQSAAALTEKLLTFGRRRATQAAPLDLGAVVGDMAEILRGAVNEDVEVVLRVPPGLGRVRADRTEIEQVLMNLAVNARDAMPSGGALVIDCRDVTIDRSTPLPSLAAPGPYVLLSVSDTGVGMDAEVQQRLFEPFFTTKGGGRGTGLGLATVYGIVTQCGGHIAVYSEPRRGTTFKVYLPRLDEESPAPPAPTPSAQAVRGGSETVLLVEDAEALRRLTREMLEGAGYTVLEATSGDQGLRVAGSHKGQLGLLLTDLVLPDMTGRELAGWLQVAEPGVKVVYMSGYSDEAATQRGELAAGATFLQKPFSSEALLRQVRAALDGTLG